MGNSPAGDSSDDPPKAAVSRCPGTLRLELEKARNDQCLVGFARPNYQTFVYLPCKSKSTASVFSVDGLLAIAWGKKGGKCGSLKDQLRGGGGSFPASIPRPKKPRGGESAAAAKGREIHARYDYGRGFDREFTLDNRRRVDAVNLETREVIELKPNNPAAKARGLRQGRDYALQLDRQFPGEPFTYRVITYD